MKEKRSSRNEYFAVYLLSVPDSEFLLGLLQGKQTEN